MRRKFSVVKKIMLLCVEIISLFTFSSTTLGNHSLCCIQGKPVTEIILTHEDNGKSLEMSVGDALLVQLEESPTTGYLWTNKTVDDNLVLQDSDFLNKSNRSIGGVGMRILRFAVVKPGVSQLLLINMKEWEGESLAIETFSVTIKAIQP